MTPTMIFSLIFVLILLLLITGRYHRSVAAMLGALLVIGFGIRYGLFGMGDIMGFVDVETVILIIGLMILCEALGRSGFFQFLGISLANAIGGDERKLTIVFVFLAMLFSAVLVNITSMIIIGSLTVSLLRKLKKDPKRAILYEAVVTNVGGLMLIIGSAPNIIVASEVNIGFVEFAIVAIPLTLILAAVSIVLIYRKIEKPTSQENFSKIDPWSVVENRGVFYRSALIFLAVFILFILNDFTRIGLGVVAICGATAMLMLSGEEPESIFASVDWGTIFFLTSFFIVVGGLERSGVISAFAQGISKFLIFNLSLTSVFNVWISGLSSSLIDIPATVVLIPVMFQLSSITGIALKTLIWGVVFGANLGGNLTPLDSTNIVALGILKKEGVDVGWGEWIKTYAPIACVHLAIASVYVALLSIIL